MLRTSLIGGGFSLFLAAIAPAEDRREVPTTTPPRFVSVVEVKGDVVVYRDFMSLGVSIKEPEPNRAERKGIMPASPFAGPAIPCAVEFSLKGGEVYDAEGARLDPEAARKRLVPGATVLVSTSGRTVDPAYLRIVEKKTLVLVHPIVPPGPPLPGGLE